MKLRIRILLFAGITLACLITVIYLFSSRLLLQNYAELERSDTEENVERARLAFSQLSADLYVKAVDWSSWDDSYRFMADHNQPFIKSNLPESALSAMQMDAIIYLDKGGRLFCASVVKRLKNVPKPSPDRIVSELGLDKIRMTRQDQNGGFYGFIMLSECPMLVTVRPVLTSKGSGPARGWLIFARYFDSVALKDLSQRTRLDVQTWQPASTHLTSDGRAALHSLKAPSSIVIRPLNTRSVAGYSVMYDANDRPALLVRITQPRSIYQQGVKSVYDLMRLILIAASVFSVVILLTLERFAFSRLSSLTSQVRRIGGEYAPGRVHLSGRDDLALLADTINGMLVTLEQNSQKLRERTEQIEYQAFHDALTNLPNRALFKDRLRLALVKARRTNSQTAVILFDLDNFKRVNDTLGHEAGDLLFKAVAERLLECVRVGDTVARFGGDEFIILLEDVDGAQTAVGIAKRIMEVLAAPIRIASHEIVTSASIGIAVHETESDAPDALLRNADSAMYEAKSRGKSGYVLFDSLISDRAAGRLEIEMALHSALVRGEFTLNYQPLVSLESNHMIGVEALLRWTHPTLGSIPPGKFIPIAEDSGLIVPIGYWVLEEACRQMKTWMEQNPDFGMFTMNINFSGKQLLRPDVVQRVQDVLQKTAVNPSQIKLEITESVLMTEMQTVIDRLQRIKSFGVKLAMDDFGMGYSCMANMASFPLDTIKIDKTFIQRLTNQEANSKHMVEAIVALSRALKLDVTGEGVETIEQAAQLKSLGCDVAQGFYFARPLTVDALTSFIAAGPASLTDKHKPAARDPQDSMPLAA